MRNKGLDVLRAIAIILVLFRHAELNQNILVHFGWLGVDLFFVLSGFLVSGLLFKEYKESGKMDTKRFLFRRCFKIFPPFYFFVLVTLLFEYYVNGNNYSWQAILAELFYFQNYTIRIWLHTWSLNVEEHFYLLLILAVIFALKKGLLHQPKYVISFLISLLILSFMMRYRVSYPHEDTFHFMRTHLRADGIIFGVLLAYLHHFTGFTARLLNNKRVVTTIAIVLVLPGFYFEGGRFFMNVYGLTLVNAGFALFVLLALELDKLILGAKSSILGLIINGFCFIGINSYSIYLWHLNMHQITYASFSLSKELLAAIYILLSVLAGTLFSYLIEKRALQLRDKNWSLIGS